MSAIQRNVLLLEVSTQQGPELYLDVSATEECAAPGGVYTTGACAGRVCLHYRGLYVLLLEVSAKGPELHLDVSTLQRNVLLLEVSTLQGPEVYLDVSATEECAAPGGVHTTEA